MSEWKTYKLSEILNLISGGTPKTTNPDFWNGNIPWLSIVDFGNANKYVYKAEKSITEEGLKKSSTNILKKGQIIISARGTVGALAVLDRDMAFNQSCYGINANDLTSNEFLYYLLKDSIQKIQQNTHGAVFDTITRNTFDHIEVTIPPKAEQQKIASILSSLDDKIELNNQMNQTLEQIAQAIFKEWFVDFNFPGFDGNLVDGLPKGWRKGKIVEEFNLTMGQSPKGESLNIDKEGIIFYQGRTDYGFRFPQPRVYTTSPTRFANQLDTLVCVRAPVGDINMAIDKCCVGRGLAAIMHKKKAFSYTLYLMKYLEPVFKTFEKEGTVFGAINKAGFENIEHTIPSFEIISLFEKTVNVFDEKIIKNSLENEQLIEIRNSLIPRLLSGNFNLN